MKQKNGEKSGMKLKDREKGLKETRVEHRIEGDFAAAWEEYRSFELAYRFLLPDDLAYLEKQSALYKKAVMKLQQRILPAVRKHCPACPHGTCCRLHSPELKIYIARSIGGFTFVDYLLARHKCAFPSPKLGNIKKNLCVFWKNGCRLDPVARSHLCLQYFCATLRGSLDMKAVDDLVANVRTVVDGFSLRQLLQKDNNDCAGSNAPSIRGETRRLLDRRGKG